MSLIDEFMKDIEGKKKGENEMETYKYEDVWRVKDKKNDTNTHNEHPNHSF